MIFKHITHIDDIKPHVENKPEIRWATHANGVTTACYKFCDSKTFDVPEALECRGIAFDANGEICSRPLHKFFNLGERADHSDLDLSDAAVFEKLDGSMIATAWVNGALQWRSKASFESDVVKLATELVDDNIVKFATECAANGLTAIFELTHPSARIVVDHEKPALTLLHVRDNVTGQYVMLDGSHWVYDHIDKLRVPVVPESLMSPHTALAALATMTEQEGFVFQLSCGDMLKAKCDWYLRAHKALAFRERDIARLALHGELDDMKPALAQCGVDMAKVNVIETFVNAELCAYQQQIDAICYDAKYRGYDRKAFALEYKNHNAFSVAIRQFMGQPVDLADWYERNLLNKVFGLDVL